MSTKPTFTEQQERLIEKYRECNTDYQGWWESMYEHFDEQLAAIGLTDTDKQFSGFYSQGDGASITFSSWTLDDMLTKSMERIAEHEALDPATQQDRMQDAIYREVTNFAYGVRKDFAKYLLLGGEFRDTVLAECYVSASRITHHYSHARTVSAQWNFDGAERWENSELFESSGLRAQLMGDDIDSAVEDLANALYAALKEEYEDLSSDESVWDTIQANEWDKLPENQPDEDEDEEDECQAA